MELEAIASGYCFLEAPRVDGDSVWFSDLLIGGLYRWSPGGKVETFLPDVHHIGGAVINQDGRILCGGTEGLIWFDPESGKHGVLLDSIAGQKLGVDDMYPDGSGGLYFGTLARPGPDGPSPTALCRLQPDGTLTVFRDGLKPSNGIGLSPDCTKLYHVESLLAVNVYDVLPDGSLGDWKTFCDQDDGDGLAVNSEGGVWIASFAAGAVFRYLPDGSLDQRIPVPHKVVSSVCFGGPDWRDIYVVTAGDEGIDYLISGGLPPRIASVFRGRSDIPGVAVPRTRFELPAA